MSTEQKDNVAKILLIEEKPLERILTILGVFLALFILMIVYHKRTYNGMIIEPAALEVAQIAKNIVDSEGYTTRYIRPFNVALSHHNYNGSMPELNMAPLHPYAVFAAFKLISPSGEMLVRVSLAFIFLTAIIIFFLGRFLFDWKAGLLAAGIFGISLQVLEIGVSGLEWPLATFLFTILLYIIAKYHSATIEENHRKMLICVLASAFIIAMLYLTHHALVYLCIPAAVYFAITRPRKKIYLIVFLLAFITLISPWAYRNYAKTGFPVLGATAWDLISNTNALPYNDLYRSTAPENLDITRLLRFPIDNFPSFSKKLMTGSVEAARNAAGIISIIALPFAIVSMLYKFKSVQANAIRGLFYGILPIIIIVSSLYSLHKYSILILAPPIAVLASAYFLLLVEAKKLHPFYKQALISGFITLAFIPTFTNCIWPREYSDSDINMPARNFFTRLEEVRVSKIREGIPPVLVFTDSPWIAAWYTNYTTVLLPKTDADVWELNARGLPMTVICLTPECEKYSYDEMWYKIHKIRMWRQFLMDPKKGTLAYLKEARISTKKADAYEKYFLRQKRSHKINESIEGARIIALDPMSPDDIQIIEIPQKSSE